MYFHRYYLLLQKILKETDVMIYNNICKVAQNCESFANINVHFTYEFCILFRKNMIYISKFCPSKLITLLIISNFSKVGIPTTDNAAKRIKYLTR